MLQYALTQRQTMPHFKLDVSRTIDEIENKIFWNIYECLKRFGTTHTHTHRHIFH
jgi:hypothetical protein